ncbi:LAFA_0C00210g1_1 [Lachancea sp. 'fantastica']|nr:LAFA_0C00210g1_1 [Lachancea sp. 'fantastica']
MFSPSKCSPKDPIMSSTQHQNENLAHVTESISSPTAWYSHRVFLVTFRILQFASTITALGLIAFLVDSGSTSGFELAVSAISLTYLIVVASAKLPLNLYSVVALSASEVVIFALWVGASATLGIGYDQYSCEIYWSGGGSYGYFDFSYYFQSLSKECRVGKASIAFAAFSAFLSLCALALFCKNVSVPMNAVLAGKVHTEDTRAYLCRFTGLAIANASVDADAVDESGPVDVEAAPATALVEEEAGEPAHPADVEVTKPTVPVIA